MIELIDVNFDYTDFKGEKKELLKDISFKIDEKERVVLLGINGSGKSTLLKILDALVFPKSGSYFYKGTKIGKRGFKKISRSFRKEVAFLMQDPNMLLFNATVKEEIEFGLRQFGFDDIESRVVDIAKRFGLEKYLDIPPFYLSGGEKQRVALASLIAIEPEVLLMDEPSANLDPPTTGWLVDLLNDMDITTVISTHNLSLAPEFGDRVLVLSDEHRLIFDGSLEEFVENRELMMEAKLLHKHRHKHGPVEHTHFHLHDWE
ncbi:energy-coupling factor ABC transporter ATP-binding protein [Nitrosophilus alvini]|uniref:energy-coupling factor ABC transporter ATP-binding protein n=1 Tax=Nitrosophilus alvini TaxID=2714855 RepID=UPI001F312053|nr:energy-coupling factor ABC transporter ATP-binding protein [Nitrosophilus alvini]